MLQRLRNARLIWPTLMALAGLAVLIALGTWQMQRKRWKEDLIGRIAARVHADAVSLPLEAGAAAKDDLEYLHVTARGRFHHDKERYLYAPTAGNPGWHVYTPLELPSHRVVWVNRGWVPESRKAPETRRQGQIQGEVEVRGLVRGQSKPGLFTARNEPSHNVWYWPDLPAMTASAFAGGPLAADPLPLVVEADARPEPPGGLPRGGVTRLELPNRHLEYALTWYGLAAALAGVYLSFGVSRLRAAA
ncbi:MAG TPA: SURF1 family protein [Hyphomicrobiaceae bacterium]|jgi:surfeit locus 1 family protein